MLVDRLLLEELKDLDDIFTGFEGFDLDGEVLNEKESKLLNDDDFETMYEVVFRSPDSAKIERIKHLWEEIDEESDISG